jgi:hypothetical protein
VKSAFRFCSSSSFFNFELFYISYYLLWWTNAYSAWFVYWMMGKNVKHGVVGLSEEVMSSDGSHILVL